MTRSTAGHPPGVLPAQCRERSGGSVNGVRQGRHALDALTHHLHKSNYVLDQQVATKEKLAR